MTYGAIFGDAFGILGEESEPHPHIYHRLARVGPNAPPEKVAHIALREEA